MIKEQLKTGNSRRSPNIYCIILEVLGKLEIELEGLISRAVYSLRSTK